MIRETVVLVRELGSGGGGRPDGGCWSGLELAREGRWNVLVLNHVYVFILTKEIIELLLVILVGRSIGLGVQRDAVEVVLGLG